MYALACTHTDESHYSFPLAECFFKKNMPFEGGCSVRHYLSMDHLYKKCSLCFHIFGRQTLTQKEPRWLKATKNRKRGKGWLTRFFFVFWWCRALSLLLPLFCLFYPEIRRKSISAFRVCSVRGTLREFSASRIRFLLFRVGSKRSKSLMQWLAVLLIRTWNFFAEKEQGRLAVCTTPSTLFIISFHTKLFVCPSTHSKTLKKHFSGNKKPHFLETSVHF